MHWKVLDRIRTGTVYSTFGLGFPGVQFSRMERRELEEMPCESVATSSSRVDMFKWNDNPSMAKIHVPICSQSRFENIGRTPLHTMSLIELDGVRRIQSSTPTHKQEIRPEQGLRGSQERSRPKNLE
jgi:hypothetical protein